MKIIERGTARQVQCHNCGSVLEHEDKDVRMRLLPNDRRDWGSSDPEDAYEPYITCPVCSSSFAIRVSSHLKLQLYNAHKANERFRDHDL